jgi:hypothetical protein
MKKATKAAVEINCDGLTLEQWTARADETVQDTIGLRLDDLADQPTWDAWQAGDEPESWALEMLRSEVGV